ncbi:hypothetical protein DUT91_24230 [Phyllobacterium salinisoli]|uniref:EscV/YscV/HrcV family type III secretion system export apparatus protein n=1 Tax=Phyllobacterium salinisoli TaxID=1899321 RepID=A0A368JW78_9HYPH|nr:flagellar biosynthesis protein FlhA [Phyllobacterium salinisoli]RCS21426.1 hypothetical protein DUT91_24230 [Phyllobacterium salinisoli]
MNGKLTGFLAKAAQQKDMFLVVLLALVLVMLILPLPEFLIDVLITMNISAAILILLTSFHLLSPVQFSTFPSVLLLTTLFRLAISISTTRLILMDGSAGAIIKTFGEVVVGGNLVVGLVIFLVITLVQFLVITKGADRVAEIGARFALDGMPGKQMSIDADVRAGNLDVTGAQQARQKLEMEAKLFGSMDGAMKFVKGDAIAGLVIAAVNLLGGIAIGSFQHGMPMGDALHLYSLMTVGDGLVAQIPALMISMAAGSIVTRVANPDDLNLGTEIAQQLLGNRKTLLVAGLLISLFGFVPGFPTLIFLAIGVVVASGPYFVTRRERAMTIHAEADWTFKQLMLAETCNRIAKATGSKETVMLVLPSSIISINVSYFSKAFEALKASLEKEFFIKTGYWKFEIGNETELYRIFIKQELVGTGKYDPGAIFIKANPSYLLEMGIPPLSEFGAREGVLVDAKFSQKLQEDGVEFWSPCEQLLMHVKSTAIRNLEVFATFQNTSDLLFEVQRGNAALINDLREAMSNHKISQIMRFLLRERIPLTNHTRILEAILLWSNRRPDPLYVLQRVRREIADVITQRFALEGFLPVMVVAPTLESFIREGIRNTEEGTFLVLEPSICRHIVNKIREIIGEGYKKGQHPVLITQQDIRHTMYNIFHEHGIYMPVLAYQEVSPETVVYPVGYLSAEPD